MNTRPLMFGVLAIAVAASLSCRKRGGDHDDDGVVQAPAPPEISYAPAGSTPPVVVTLNIGIAENRPMADLTAVYQKFVTVNQSLWNVTEGQVRIGRVRIRDNSHPGTQSQDYDNMNFNSSTVDIVVWQPGDFNGPGISFVAIPQGRNGRFMGIPTNVANTTLLHELGHFTFVLSWPPGPLLVDEYTTQPDDNGCIMELDYVPLRWCWTDNHLSQASQPRSCWSQILMDYPAFLYANTNTSPTPPPDPEVEYTDVP
jgi:hypothetical protein